MANILLVQNCYHLLFNMGGLLITSIVDHFEKFGKVLSISVLRHANTSSLLIELDSLISFNNSVRNQGFLNQVNFFCGNNVKASLYNQTALPHLESYLKKRFGNKLIDLIVNCVLD